MGLWRNFGYLCFFLTFCGVAFSETTEYYDAIVTEAASEDPTQQTSRDSRQAGIFLPSREEILASHNDDSASSPLLTGPCFTSKGSLGRCMSFRQCYPYFKLPDVNNWDTWILGMYDTCSYYTIQGRQMFGVCCTNPVTSNPDEVPVPTSTEASNEDNSNGASEESIQQNPDNMKIPNYPQPAVWPPPLPTHPPHHTIPPLPTHPPSPGWPFPAYPTPVYPLPTTSQPPAAAPAWPAAPTPAIPLPIPGGGGGSGGGGGGGGGISSGSCGAKNGYQDQERIVGGHNADLGEWPWIAGLFNAGRQFCGGSLIDDIHILSAAHCVAHMSSWDVARLTVRLGDHNIRTNSEVKHTEKKVKRVVRHRGFNSQTLYNDVSILTLESPVTFSHQIRPICLPSQSGETYAGKTATVIGWGSIRESGPQPAVLQEVSIPIWSNNECRLKYGAAAPGGIVEHMLCAGQASRDSCSGDSGGPLMVNSGKWTQVGIVSWGIGCGKGQYPGVYVRVQTFLPWIHKNLKG